MKRFLRSAVIMVITFIVIIGIFWFILPVTGLAETLGSAYIFVALIGSLGISYAVSWLLGKVIREGGD